MSDWKEYILASITEPIKEPFKPNGLKEIKYIGLEHIEQETLRLSGVGSSGDVSSNKFQFKSNDILFGKLRPYFRKVVKPQFDGICSTDIWVFRAKKEFDQGFLYYFLANWDFINIADGGEGGTRMPRADWNFLKQTIWNLPGKTEQTAIAEVLSSLDDKIDLLHRQNNTLEQLAETLFRQWFVEKAEESWPNATLADHTEVFRGLSYKGSGLSGNGIGLPMHNLNSVYEFGGYKSEGIKYYKGEYRERHLLNAGDIIVTNTEQGHEHRLIGFPGIVPKQFGEKGLFSQHIYRLMLLRGTYLTNQFIYYLLMSPSIREQIIAATNGSTVNMLAIEGLQLPEFKLPPNEKVIKFSDIANDYWKKKELNHYQIRTLTQLRDSLLPKLMSGEVRVKM
jgi:type I restriction enzyme S subunit